MLAKLKVVFNYNVVVFNYNVVCMVNRGIVRKGELLKIFITTIKIYLFYYFLATFQYKDGFEAMLKQRYKEKPEFYVLSPKIVGFKNNSIFSRVNG